MEQFKVDEYQVSVSRTATSHSENSVPTIFVRSDSSTGVTTTLRMYFQSRNRTAIDRGYLGLSSTPTHSTFDLAVVLSPDSFGPIYDILRNEAPVTALFELRDRGPGQDRPVVKVQIGTHWEDTGEGPADPSA